MPDEPAGLLRIDDRGGFAVVEIVAAKLTDGIGEALERLIEAGPERRIVLDCGRLTFLSSAAIGRLVGLFQRLEAAGGRLRICGLHPNLAELLRFAHLDRVIELHEHRDSALESPW